MGSTSNPRPHATVMMSVMVVLLIAIPAAAAMAALEDSAQEALAEERALAELERLHALPETLEYVPPAPWYADQLQAEGYGHEFEEPDTNMLVMSNPAPMAATGTRKVATLAIEFTDVKHSGGSTVSALQGKLTGTNSMRSYFNEVSYDKLTIDGTAYGWYEADNDMAYYGKPEGGNHDSRNFYQLVAEAVRAADPDVDFSQYDTNRDRIIDGICLVHAGRDEATGGGANTIWSKQSVYPGTLRVDGVYLGYYFTVSEYSPVGVYVHEFGHMLGLPDLYDTDYSSTGVGMWDVMGSGAWGNWGRTPTHPSAWSKLYMGWVDPTVISNYVEGREINYMEGDSPEVIKLPTEKSNEYFLLENRYQTNYDRYLPGSGILIWHIDTDVINQWIYYNRVNNNEARKGVDLEEGSGTQDLDEWGSNDGDSSDPWKNNAVGFTPTSTPNSNHYDGTPSNIKVFNISAANLVMTLDIDFGGDSWKIVMDTISSFREAAPGQEVLYNVTVGTRSSTGDTIDLSLTGTHASWGTLVGQTYIVLSAKGSDKVQVKVVPPAGTPKGTEGEVILKATSRGGSTNAQVETITKVIQVHALTADPTSRSVDVVPGTPKTVDFTITNSGNGLENITLSLEAERGYWGTVNPSRISVGVLRSETVRVTFTVPEGVLAGEEEPFQLTLLSEVLTSGEMGQQITLKPTLSIDVLMVVEEVVALRWGNIQDQSVVPGGTVPYELLLFNEGNSDVDVLVAYQAPEGWMVEFENGENMTIGAFQVETLNVTVSAPDDAEADARVTIDLSATRGVQFFYSQMTLTVEQLYLLTTGGDTDLFADPGERAMFTVSVTNLGNGPDRVTMGVIGNGWETEVTPNLIDLGYHEGDSTREILVYMTPPDDAEAFDENTVTVTLTSGNGLVTARHEITLNVNPVTSFRVDTEVVSNVVDTSDDTKSRATYFIHIENTGNLEDLFHIGLIGLPDGWTSEFDNRMLSVPANKRKMVQFQITPPATGDNPAKAGTIEFRVHVASEMGSSDPVEPLLSVTVAANRGHSVRPLEPSYSAPSGAKLTFRVLVVNEGNVPERVTLSAVGELESYSFEHLEVSLEPFGQKVVNLTVELPSVTDDTRVEIQVVAITTDLSSQASVPVPIDVEGRSGAPGPGAVAALMAVMAIAAVSVVLLRRRR